MKSSNDENLKAGKDEFGGDWRHGLPDPLAGYSFARDYLAGNPQATRFTPGGPRGPDAAIAARDANPVALLDDGELQEVMDFNISCGNLGGAERARQLSAAGTLAVVTGQQPNLLCSPLYVLFKALTACAKAKRLEARTGRRVVPVFWVASDDHDFQELRDCWLPDSEGLPLNLGVLVSRGRDIPVASPAYEWTLDASAERLLAGLRRQIPDGAGRRLTLDAVSNALRRPVTFESCFCRMLAAYLAREGMVFVVPRMAFIRRRQRGIIRREIEADGETTRRVMERAGELAAAGYTPLVQRRPSVLNCFYIMDRMRTRLVRRGPHIYVENPATGAVLVEMAVGDLIEHLDRHWDSFSPNVILRPVVQDAVLPTVEYVGGPGEITYLAQVAPAWEFHGVAPALPVLRTFATVIGAAGRSLLDRLGVPGAAAEHDFSRLLNRLLDADPELGRVMLGVRELEQAAEGSLGQLAALPAAKHPHVEVAVGKTRRTMRFAIEKLRGRLARRFAENDSREWKDYSRLMAMLAPMSQPQERILSPLALCGDHEPEALVAALVEAIDFGQPEPVVAQLAARDRHASLPEAE
jgi:bacillithiol biosynthesis cysteine-adding enzyme BshC